MARFKPIAPTIFLEPPYAIHPEHEQIADTVRKFVANEINPFTAEWERPASSRTRALQEDGRPGPCWASSTPRFGGMGLDFSYSMVMAEAWGDCNVGGVPMAIGVQTDMCTRRWRALLGRAAHGFWPFHCR